MVDFDCKTDRITNLPNKNSPVKLTNKKVHIPSRAQPFRPSGELSPASESACSAYDQYLRLPELRRLWNSNEFPGWSNEPILKPALQALEITFRFISIVLSDPRPYINRREWCRRLEALACDQVEIVAQLYQEEDTAPIVDLSSSFGNASSSSEVWMISGESTTVVSRASEASLLPRLAAWERSEPIANKILYSIECAMRRCPFTLGLGEPNLTGKPSLNYDAVCRPSELHALKQGSSTVDNNHENQYLYNIHQIFESWIYASSRLLDRIESNISTKDLVNAAGKCWLLERIWKLLEEIERLHLLMDPDDFLQAKTQLRIKSGLLDSESFCFRSRGLVEMTKRSKDLRHKVPEILDVEVDPMGGPIIQEAAMKLYREKGMFEKIHLLQAMQGIESSVKEFFYMYKQLLVVSMGSLEAHGNRAVSSPEDTLAQIFLEPTYYPSLDAAKTFLGGFWDRHRGRH